MTSISAAKISDLCIASKFSLPFSLFISKIVRVLYSIMYYSIGRIMLSMKAISSSVIRRTESECIAPQDISLEDELHGREQSAIDAAYGLHELTVVMCQQQLTL